MKLATYLKRSKRSVSEFAGAVGADRVRIYRYLLHEGGDRERGRRPDLDTAFAIERETSGQVPASAWVERSARAA